MKDWNFKGSLTLLGFVGRPKGVKEQDVYICDYRLDKSAHLFYKIHRNRYPVCTKPYAFDHFPKKLTPKRDFSVSLLCRDSLVHTWNSQSKNLEVALCFFILCPSQTVGISLSVWMFEQHKYTHFAFLRVGCVSRNC